jgi:predicted component of type VI protein secretion system
MKKLLALAIAFAMAALIGCSSTKAETKKDEAPAAATETTPPPAEGTPATETPPPAEGAATPAQ